MPRERLQGMETKTHQPRKDLSIIERWLVAFARTGAMWFPLGPLTDSRSRAQGLGR